MVTIEKLNRAYEIKKYNYRGERKFHSQYIETEEEFIKNIENLCNTIGEENLISVQFLNDKENKIDGCIITFKEVEEENMKYWEIEFECDDSWSISGIYSFFMKQETEPTLEDIQKAHGIYPNKDGLGNIIRIIDITDEAEHYEELADL